MGSAARVLIVDDDDAIAGLVGLALEEDGYEVVAASHGAAALQLLAQEGPAQPAAILLDLRMPVMDGWDFARAYRERVVLRAPIIVLTAAPDPGDCAAAIDASDVLPKPFDLDELRERVARYAHRRAA
jgi:CheY-like chemotaxis protein